MRPMEPILAYASLLALCYFLALVRADNIGSRSKRSLGEFRPRNLFGTLIHQGRLWSKIVLRIAFLIILSGL